MQQEAQEQSHAQLAEKAARLRNIPKINYSIPEACHAAGVGRSTLYDAIMAGELATLKLGKRRLIPVDELHRWLAAKRAAL